MRTGKQKHVTEKIIHNFLYSSRFIEERTKEILVSSIGASASFNSFLKEFVSSFKMKGFKVLIVSAELIKDDQICLTLNNDNVSSESSRFKYNDKFFFSLKEGNKLLQVLPSGIKDSYDVILYCFDKNNPFVICPSILNCIKNIVVFINKKNTKCYDLIEIEESLKDKRSILSFFVVSKK